MFRVEIAIDVQQVINPDENSHSLVKSTLLIDRGIFTYVGPRLKSEDYSAEQYFDYSSFIALPPFYNQHTHPSISLYRGLGVDLNLQDWLKQVIWPLEKEFCNPEMVYWGSLLSALEMIKSGTGSIASMDFFTDSVAEAFSQAGLRIYLGEALFRQNTPSHKTPASAFKHIEDSLVRYQGSELVNVYLAVHAPYTSDLDLYKTAAVKATELGIISTSHIAETLVEVDWCAKEYGCTPVELIEKSGILEASFVLVHGVHLNHIDIQILADHDIPLIHNPHSNMVLGSGACPVPQLLEQGVRVGLGTDSAASNNNLSMLKEMQTAAKIHKAISHDATVVSAKTALQLATSNGYQIYRHKNLGKIAKGWKADLQIIDLTKAHNVPSFDPISSLVYSAQSSDVMSVMVNGKWLMTNRQVLTINEAEVLQKCSTLGIEIKRFIAKAGVRS